MPSQKELFLRYQAQTSIAPLLLEIQKAEGIYLYDTEGRKIVDLISGISVSSLGHGNQSIIDAIKTQAEKHLHVMVYGELVQAPQIELAKLLSEFLPQQLDNIYFVSTGSEAIEGAVKLARRYTSKSKIAVAKNAYHGNTLGAMSFMSDMHYRKKFEPLVPDVYFFEFNNTASLDFIDDSFACILVEPVQGEAGYIPATDLFLSSLRNRASQLDILLLFDEIQCGMGRTGSLFAFQQYGITPDVLVLSKAFGAGLPLGAFISSKEIMSSLSHNPVLGHITTFGGHPLSCAAALAGLKELNNSGLIASVSQKEALFRKCLQHPKIKSISGRGLMLALEFDNFDQNLEIIQRCLAKGLLTDWFLFAPNKLRLAPPLIITESQIESVCNILLECIQ